MATFNWTAETSYNEANKIRFHNAARKQLKALATALNLVPGSFDIRSNKGGIAVSGEITLHSESIYIQVSQPFGGGSGILIRTCKGRKDYVGGTNNFQQLSALNNIPSLAQFVQRVR